LLEYSISFHIQAKILGGFVRGNRVGLSGLRDAKL